MYWGNDDFENHALIYALAANPFSLNDQTDRLKKFADEQGFYVVSSIQDLAGLRDQNRLGLKNVAEECRNDNCKLIIVTDLLKLFDGNQFAPGIHDKILNGEVRLVSLDEGLNTLTASNSLLLKILIKIYRIGIDRVG